MSPQVGRIVQVAIAPRGGVPKMPVPSAEIGPRGLVGDRQADTRHHGSPDQAVSLFSAEVIAHLQAEGHPIGWGTTGENLTVEGLEWPMVRPGCRLLIGEGGNAPVDLEITDYATPCSTIRGSFLGGDSSRIKHDLHNGWGRVYARVLRTGVVQPGASVRLLEPSL